jgi:alkylation response protein AidB-like acyl-CoA dehydrogenase
MFTWTKDQLAIRDAVRAFVDKEIRPHQDELEHGDLPPYDLIRKFFATFGLDTMAAESFDRSISEEASSSSGEGMDPALAVLPQIELVKVSMGIPAAIGVSIGLAAGTINANGTVEQRKRWARDLMTFEKVGAWAITEPDAGSDAFGGMRTTVKPDPSTGPGQAAEEFVLNGQKTFITNGPYADTIVVYAKLDDGSGLDRRDQPVLTFVLDSGMDGLEQSKPLKKMGMNSSPTGQLFFDHVRLGRDRLLEGSASKDGR